LSVNSNAVNREDDEQSEREGRAANPDRRVRATRVGLHAAALLAALDVAVGCLAGPGGSARGEVMPTINTLYVIPNDEVLALPFDPDRQPGVVEIDISEADIAAVRWPESGYDPGAWAAICELLKDKIPEGYRPVNLTQTWEQENEFIDRVDF
jgi:hypothetical protein